MLGPLRDDGDARALLVIAAVVTHPGLSQHLVPEPVFVALDPGAEVILRKGARLVAVAEGVGRGSQSHHRSSPVQVGIDVRHLLVRQRLEAGEDHEPVRRLEHFEPGDVRLAGLHLAVLVEPEENGAIEAVMLGQDAGERGQGFLAAILVIAGDEHEVLVLGDVRVALVLHRVGGGARQQGKAGDGR